MSENKWNIKGFVVDSQSKKGLSGLHVEAWDKDSSHDDPLVSIPTDDKGFFSLEFDESRFREHESDKLKVYLVIRHNGKEVKQTGIIHHNLEPGVTDWGHIMVNLAEADVPEEDPPGEEKATNLRTVNGRIQWSYRQPLSEASVTLFDQGMDAATECVKDIETTR
jgi:hypothetical protein